MKQSLEQMKQQWLADQKRRAATERKQWLTLIAEIRLSVKVKSLDDNVTVWIADLYSGNPDNRELSERNYYASETDIDKNIKIGNVLEIENLTLTYKKLIELYLFDLTDRICDEAQYHSSIEPKGCPIEGDIIVKWNFEKYVGYARNLTGLRFGEQNETEYDMVTGNEESTFRTNYSVLIEASELDGLSQSEKVEKIKEALSLPHWKWNYFNTPKFDTLIKDHLNLSIPEACINCGADVTTPDSNLCNTCGEVALSEYYEKD